jgi:diacylglycerol kinase
MKNRSDRFSLQKRLHSFYCAFRGFAFAFRQEHNLWIHTPAAAVVVAAGFFFHISATEWVLITIVIAGVFASELINSAIENMVDLCSPEFDRKAGCIKDMAAGAVLITALGALVTGLIVFIPKITEVF